MAHSVWTGGSRHTGRAALPHKNIHSILANKGFEATFFYTNVKYDRIKTAFLFNFIDEASGFLERISPVLPDKTDNGDDKDEKTVDQHVCKPPCAARDKELVEFVGAGVEEDDGESGEKTAFHI